MDRLSSRQRSECMSRVRSRNTKPELVVRKMAWGLGLRYRLNVKGLPGKPDLVFPRGKRAVLVHGCFWHQHEGCRRAALPKTRAGFWRAKLQKNVVRDGEVFDAMRRLGWKLLVVWECELREPSRVLRKLGGFLKAGP